MAVKYTRKQYLEHEIDHWTYYGQFGIHLIGVVTRIIGYKRIVESGDRYFNDIPLHRWDGLHGLVTQRVGRMIAEANGPSGGVSISDTTCAAKAAAHIVRKQHRASRKLAIPS